MTIAGGFNTAMGEVLIGSFSLLVCRGYAHSQCSDNLCKMEVPSLVPSTCSGCALHEF